MNILLDGYFDRNFGDDMMMQLAAFRAPQHMFYVKPPRAEMFLPFSHVENILPVEDERHVKYDAYLKVIGSGFIFRRKWDAICRYRAVGQLKKERKDMPMALMNCNIDAPHDIFSKAAVCREMKLYSYISVRDRDSFAQVEKLKVPGKVTCYPDMLFSLPDEWLFSLTDEKCLGLSVYRNLFADNLACYKALAALADWYIETTQKKVLLFALDVETENDLAAAHTVRSLCRHSHAVEIIAHVDNGSHIIKNMARCQTMVGMRFHSIVLAMRMGIPVLPIAYAGKTIHMLRDIGYTEKILDWKDITAQKLIAGVQGAKSFSLDKGYLKRAESAMKDFLKYVCDGKGSW